MIYNYAMCPTYVVYTIQRGKWVPHHELAKQIFFAISFVTFESFMLYIITGLEFHIQPSIMNCYITAIKCKQTTV